ncbi:MULTISPECIES: pullulanase-type alpha-1,6-glucosidase [unclassified Vibrio]|uniref:pullulanase-type alpha-1,6-glucosidase n=2 Tax=Vibrio TaxID=662 RepID=UPI000B8ED531|nr:MULTISPECIES: pullulanase-type alpha-1,6-glucosidase [unclassified Vibrio]NAX44728.1 pullulanase-type alpha-1,6-glucosidase [Vibrio sp. V25_P4S6T154]OXX59626.1 pullulanase [Vibrio sp. V15_P4S5T153]OXX67972.1 pullulanase [Vibrio sp. V20_P4S3T152]
MKTNLTRMTLAFASIGMLAGCNDSLDVQVMDGYLTNAQVWLDVNGNRQFEQNEPQAYTDQKGIAKINVAGLRGDVKNYYLMASAIKGKTVDQDIPTVKMARNYLMMAPANYPVISPFTTYLSVQMQNGKRESKALAELKKALRIPTLDVQADYVDNHILVAQSAKALAQLLPATIDDSSLPELANTLKKASKRFGDEIKKAQREKSDIRDKTLMLENGEPVIGFDSDRDGVADLIDHFPYDIQESIDSDNDGIGDHADLDDDNDGWPDETELRLGTDPYDALSFAADLDGDGIADVEDDDIDGDGWSNADEARLGTDANDVSSVPADLDSDGITDSEDDDIDGDGVGNAQDVFPRDRLESLDTNNDGLGDFASSDDDGDGIPDSIDPQPKQADNSTTEPTPTYQEAIIYYLRDDNNYDDWGLHLWNNGSCDSVSESALNGVDWGNPYLASEIDPIYGSIYRIPLKAEYGNCMNFIVHSGNDKALGGDDLVLDFVKGNTLYTRHGSAVLNYSPNEQIQVAIEGAAAHWLAVNQLAWFDHSEAASYELWSRAQGNGDIAHPEQFIHYPLALSGVTNNAHFPHLAGRTAFTLDVSNEQAKALLKTQLLTVARDAEGKVLVATKVQIPGIVDNLYTAGSDDADEAKLGAWIDGDSAHFALWAPTAQQVELYLYDQDKTLRSTSPQMMVEDPNTGVWHYQGERSLKNSFYRYRVQAYHPKTAQLEWMTTTDPYSQSLSTSSLYSQLVDLTAAESKPDDWDAQIIPELSHPEDNILYEVHIRDFSNSDSKGTAEYNGKYLAFLEEERDSVAHLKSLKQAGLTTIHLLPSYDLASIPEDEQKRVDLNDTVAKLCSINPQASLCSDGTSMSATILSLLEKTDPDTPQAQALLADVRPLDSFNWGYDPFHYSAPEGSYAVQSDGVSRVKEYRQMVQKLHQLGFRVVQDVVYNHTYSSGLYDKSVLDKTVPGYYHRLNPITGAVENSSCCDNTASENRMFEKLVADSVTMWAQDYKIDGFRFDLMGHLMKSSMLKIYEAAKTVDPDTWFYGEGWNFGEVANGARGENATQWPMAGTGIGTYNDRLRDGVRGGGPFDSGEALLTTPGFANAGDRFSDELKSKMDLIRYGMAGNLQAYPLQTASGMTVLGRDFQYGGQGAAYTLDPQESINYVSKHDNQTLWDFNQYKAKAETSSADRARMQIIGLAPVMLGQGVPFFHMGSELLRSKSMARDSYDSGDWYNRVDFSKQTNNWNVGLPRADKDQANWSAIQSVITNPNTVASAQDIAWTDNAFKALLAIRAQTPLLKLISEQEVLNRVRFHNTGPNAQPGMIVMSVNDGVSAGADLDPNVEAIVVAINANSVEQSVVIPNAQRFELHPVLRTAQDVRVKESQFNNGRFTVPALTAAVFVMPQQGEQGAGLSIDAPPIDVAPYGSTTVYVRGSMNGWGVSNPLSYQQNGLYTFEGYLTPGVYEFKIASEDWSTLNLGFGGFSIASGSATLENAGNGNIKLTVTEQGVWKFTLDASNTSQLVVGVVDMGVDYACYQDNNPACDLRIYQVMVESFVDGDSNVGYGVGYGNSHHRGDLQGIINSLDYIASLNVNALWLTPVFDSCAGQNGDDKLDATGYFACDYFNVDPHFGSNAKLKELIDRAHDKGMYVLLDGVFGHTSSVGVKASPSGKLPQLHDGESGYPGKLVTYPSQASEAFFTEVASYWIREFGIDGWRLDQAYQVPLESWRSLRAAVEQASQDNFNAGKSWGTLGYMVGEVWQGADDITLTAYGSDANPALSSAFNFPLRYGVMQALAVEESGASGSALSLEASWNNRAKSPYHAMPNLMLGNHDLVRFGDLIQRGNLGDYYARHLAAFSFLAAYSGPITLYYGEEIGDEVENFAAQVTQNCAAVGLCDDHVARSSGKVDGSSLSPQQQALKNSVSQLMLLRSQYPSLAKGERRNVWIDESLYADLKVYGDEQILYVLNTSTAERRLSLDMGSVKAATQLKDLMTEETIATQIGTTTIIVPALTGRLLRLD